MVAFSESHKQDIVNVRFADGADEVHQGGPGRTLDYRDLAREGR